MRVQLDGNNAFGITEVEDENPYDVFNLVLGLTDYPTEKTARELERVYDEPSASQICEDAKTLDDTEFVRLMTQLRDEEGRRI